MNAAMEEYDYMRDSKYRMYVAAVDKALKNFDYTSEWADLISALGKLNKVLSSYTRYPVIPRRIKISKRLAQCMHPALPSGVHLKALETYDVIFRSMGTQRLANELFIYSAGLFPLMGHAAMNIRPTLLTIYETHFVPLGDRLRPALSGFLSGILPGLDTGSDHFERTTNLLEAVCKEVEPAYFYTCVWQCVANNSPVRLPAITYVLSHYSKKYPMEDQLYLMGLDIGLMVDGLCAAVQDSSVLVQRSALDLLMCCLPMQNKQLLYADMVKLVTAALSTVLRRDMSLNRRLYSWLLENDVNSIPIVQIDDTDLDKQIGKPHIIAYDLLNDALKIILQNCCAEIPLDVRPYRLLTSLFDKPQIGPMILDSVLYEVFRTLYLSCLHQQKHKNATVRCVQFNGDITSLKSVDENFVNRQFLTKNCQELIKNANLLFNTLQSYYIWSYIEKVYSDAVKNVKNCKSRDRCTVNEIGSGIPSVLEICILTDFLLDIIPIESYSESTSNILPNLFNKIVSTLRQNINIVNQHEIRQSLELCTKILTKIQPVTITTQIHNTENDSFENHNESICDKSIEVENESEPNRTLEKSKSDSRINENLLLDKNELQIDESSRERSYSNQMLKKKDKASPRAEKKPKNKKSKSSSKLYDIKREADEINETPAQEKIVEKEAMIIEVKTGKLENKYFLSCLEEYKSFYVIFVKSKILPNVDINAIYAGLICDKNERTKRLEQLLKKRLEKDSYLQNLDLENPQRNFSLSQTTIANDRRRSSEYEAAMNAASNILLEFSAFPNVNNRIESDKNGCDENLALPDWLVVLIVAACCKESTRDVQIAAMSTLLEIFSLAANNNQNKEAGNTNIVINGILEQSCVNYVEENTVVIEEISQILWRLLGILTNQKQLMLCVTLLYQIHNIFDTKPFVEHVISIYLSDDYIQLDYIKQFFLLWHLGRDLSIKLPSSKNNIKNFDRSLLKILDNLQNHQKPTFKLLAESFLSHSLYHNDIARIINPILSKLLAPSTARLSIKHVNIADADGQSDGLPDNTNAEENSAKKICAVSNHNGNIMYHVMDSAAKPTSTSAGKKKWFVFSGGGGGGGANNNQNNKSDKKYNSSIISTMTSLMDDNAIVTKKNKDFKNISLSPRLDKASKGLVKLIVNPLGAKEVYPNGAEGFYNKLDSHSSSDEDDLSSSNDNTITSTDDSYTKTYPNGEAAADSGFDSMRNKSHLELRSLFTQNAKLIDSVEQSVNADVPKITKSHSFDEKITNAKKSDENSLVQSWSYCMSDSANLNVELEFSKSAEEFFQPDKNPVKETVKEILNEILDAVCANENCLKSPPAKAKNFAIHSIHSHICLYCEVFDSNQVLYALQTLKNCINCNAQLFIKCLATSGVQNLKNSDILTLLARHRKSLLGYGFAGDLNYEYLNFYRGYMFLDVIVSVCLNYARTFYPLFCDAPSLADEIGNNLKIQLESLDILHVIIKNLRHLVNENSKGFANYIADLLVKCKLQNVLLHCLLISVRDFDEEMSFAEEILLFNNFQLCKSKSRMGEHVEAFQIQILRLIHSLIILEHCVFSSKQSSTDQTQKPDGYLSYTLIPNQNIFLSAILSALRNKCMRSMHEKWLNMITSCLPYFGENLKQISISVIHQICNNIEDIASNYKKSEIADEFCSDYAVTQLEALTILCHYCLLDSSQTVNQNVPVSATTPISTNPGEIFNNLVNVFFSPLTSEMGVSNRQQNSDHYQNARKTILSHMPRIISSVAKLWQTIVNLENDDSAIFGSTKIVKQQLLEFLSPISVHHGGSFLAAVAVAWYERRNLFANVKTVLPEPNAGQNNLVYLISAIRVIPLDNLVQTVTAVIKNPPPIEGLTADICLDVSILELFYSYMRNASATQLSEAWTSLLALIRESSSLSPPAQFLLASLLYELMVKCCPLEERKDQKDLQDVTAKLIESVSQVCGSCLEQTTWLRRNLAVKEQEGDSTPDSSIISTPNDLYSNSNHSVHAQLVLAEILAPMLDICFGSSEKDKVNTILSSLMYNIVPYLKTHTTKNMASFNACSKLLSSLSSYQYTRKAWKKDVFDLLLDNAFFQMDYSSLKCWKVIVDNLMTHDNTTFRDLMNRVSMTQSGSLNIFSSKELEYEQKAQLLKRLAYVIFCSEMDQYAKYMPDIQEQLTSSLRLSVPGIQAQVFLCFRVILLRMSPLHVTSLWPIIISEMLQVFMQIEQQLLTDTDEFSSHIKLMSTLDASWAINSNNGLHALGHPHWLRLQLATAKLLDVVLLLPATSLPQFQMYRWAFVGDDLHHKSHTPQNESTFIPHVVRIAELMDCRFVDAPIETLPMKNNELLLTDNNIKQLRDLHGFFKTLSLCSNRHRTECSRYVSNDYNFNERQSDRKMDLVLEKIDRVVESDFLDKIPR